MTLCTCVTCAEEQYIKYHYYARRHKLISALTAKHGELAEFKLDHWRRLDNGQLRAILEG